MRITFIRANKILPQTSEKKLDADTPKRQKRNLDGIGTFCLFYFYMDPLCGQTPMSSIRSRDYKGRYGLLYFSVLF